MNNRNVLKVTCIGLILLASFSLSSTPVMSRNYLYTVDSSLSLSSDSTDLGVVDPIDETITRTITISYDYPRFARPEGFPLPNRKMPTTINLTIAAVPTWCIASLDPMSFEAPIASFLQAGTVNFTAELTATINTQEAPAFSEGIIEIEARALQNGNINAATASLSFIFEPDFVPSIEVSVDNAMLNIKEGETKTVNLTVKNMGNAKISAGISAMTTQNESIDITLPIRKSIKFYDEETFVISVKANDKEVSGTITFTVDYYATQDSIATGMPIEMPITFTLTGESEDDKFLDLLPYVLAIVVIFVILFIIASAIAYRRRTY